MNLLTLNYWFEMRPAALVSFAQKGLYGLSLVLLVAWIASVLLIRTGKGGIYQRVIKKFGSFFAINFFIGLMLSFFTYELIPFLSSRFWFLLWLIEMIAWAYIISKDLVAIPQRIEELKKEREIKKYIP